MDFKALLGRSVTLRVRRFTSSGAFLGDPADEGADDRSLLLLGSEIPPGARVGDELEVFVCLDSEDRPLVTTRTPKLKLGEVAFLRVTSCTNFGAFVDWGLAKELLVPFKEQTRELHVGSREPIGVYLDDSGRLAGTMRVAELLDDEPHDFVEDQWLAGEAWRNDPEIGLFAILERRFLGLVPASEPHRLTRGQAARFRVSHVHTDGKLELSLRAHAHHELENDAETVLRILSKPGVLRVGDHSSPEQVRALFGLSKKAFKRAAGRLLKQGLVRLDAHGCLLVVRTGD
ncbi:MAG TPA: S1-like domain-containing RNA-binding protein [Polyangiaceae bacterium]|nr:S1-like domain-containing RNA-binding protein [Polyangiaceae bacterium]